MAATRTKRSRPSLAARRVGYVIAIAVNVGLLIIANNLLDWGWFSFLTADFSDVLWLLNLSFGAGIAANLMYIANDSRRPKAAGQVVTNIISFFVGLRTLQVFPFDFSGWETDWSWLFRVMLIVGIVGAAIGAVVELVKLLGSAVEPNRRAATD